MKPRTACLMKSDMALLDGLAELAQFGGDVEEDLSDGISGCGNGGGMARATHAGVEEVTHAFIVGEAFEDHFGIGAATSGLHFDAGEAEPAFEEIGAEVDILDARIVEHDFVAEDEAPTHVDALFIEAVAHGVVAEIEEEEG